MKSINITSLPLIQQIQAIIVLQDRFQNTKETQESFTII